MKTFTFLISALLLFIFIGEAQSQNKTKNSNLKKSKIDMPATKKDAGFNPDGYCSASGLIEDEYIHQVQIGDINNTSGWDGYSDYTGISTNLPLNMSWQAWIAIETYYDLDSCGIWIDWNRDEDFEDPEEAIPVTLYMEGFFTASISPPTWATTGDCRLRIRLTYNLTPTPCGDDSYGEVEDYTITLTPKVDNEWYGTVSNSWNDAGNWSLGHVPEGDENVVIQNLGNQPVQVSANAFCNNLSIASGELDITGGNLTVNGNMIIAGKLSASVINSVITCYGNVDWNDNSTANFPAYTAFNVYGHWFFNTGANAQLANGKVNFIGNAESSFKCKSPTCSVFDLHLSKTAPGVVYIAPDANFPFVINGSFYIMSGNTFTNSTNQDIICRGHFINDGDFDFTLNNNTSTLIFDGDIQSIIPYNANGYFNNVKISPSTSVSLSGDIHIYGNLTIDQGMLDPEGYTITIDGDWTNQVGSTGFNEGTGTVVFYGAKNQNCSSETFNTLMLNKSAGDFKILYNHTIICQSYRWLNGRIHVTNGTFTANDLYDDGIFGSYLLDDPWSTVNLHQDNAQYVDLNGSLEIQDGEMNVYGGNGASYWPWAADASITMSDGILDFHDVGIYVYNSSTYTLIENVTGGTVRTSCGFQGDRSDFMPSGGTFEFYGSGDYTLSQSNGCTLYNVEINKSAKDGESKSNTGPVYDLRSGILLSDGGKTNKISLDSDVSVTYNFTVTAGSLDINVHQLDVEYDLGIYGKLIMTNAADIINCVTIDWKYGSTDDINNGEIHTGSWIFRSGTNAHLGTGNTAFVYDGIVSYDDNASFGNLTLEAVSKENFKGKSFYPARVSGNCLMKSGWGSNLPFYIEGSWEIENGASFNIDMNAGTSYCNDLILNGSLQVNNNSVVEVHGAFEFGTTGEIGMNGGTVKNDRPYSTTPNTINGTVNMSDGLFEVTNNGIVFGSTASTNITGGTLRCGGDFMTNAGTGLFTPSGGTVEFALPSMGGSAVNYIYMGNGSYFHNLLIKHNGTFTSTSSYRTDIKVNNNLTIQNGMLECYFGETHDLYVGGNWYDQFIPWGFNSNNNKVIFFGAGSSVIQNQQDFYDLVVDKSSSAAQVSLTHEMTIYKDLTIDGGVLKTNSNQITIHGDWLNNVGPDAFDEENGTVIFAGSSECLSEDFNILKINDASTIHLSNGQTVSCQELMFENTNYDGVIDVSNGTFTAWDLWDMEIYGNYYLSGENAVINLHQDASGSVDLAAAINITNGEMNIYGGDGESRWPNTGFIDPYINISGGALNFADQGINLITASTNLNFNMTGGTIKTSGSFYGDCNGQFDPEGGVVELYGTSDVNVGITGNHFQNLVINKGEGKQDGTATAWCDFEVNDSLSIQSGIFDVADKEVQVDTNIYIYGTLKMMNPAGKLKAIFGIIWKSGSDDIVDAGNIYCFDWLFLDGTNAKMGIGNTANVGYCVCPADPDAEFGNLIYNPSLDPFKNNTKNTTIKKYHDYDNLFKQNNGNKSPAFNAGKDTVLYPLRVIGNLSFLPGNYGGVEIVFQQNWKFIVQGTLDIKPNVRVDLEDSCSLYNYSDFILNGVLSLKDIATGYIEGDFDIATTGCLSLEGGNMQVFTDPVNETSIYGELKMTDGLFECTNNGISLNNTSNSISGGAIRLGGSFKCNTPGVFLPTGGTVEMTGELPGSYIDFVPGNNFYNLTINNTSGYSIQYKSDITVNNNLNILNGILECGDNPSSNYNLYVGGDWNDPAAGFFYNSGNVIFNGAGQSNLLTDEIFNNLTIDKTTTGTNGLEIPAGLDVYVLNDLNVNDGALVLQNSTFTIGNDLTIQNNAFFGIPDNVQAEINIGGDWNNLNTANTSTTGFWPGESTVTFNGVENQELHSNASIEPFFKFVVNKNDKIYELNIVSSIECLGDFICEYGAVESYLSMYEIVSHYFYGDFIIQNGYCSMRYHGNVTFTGNNDSKILISENSFCNFQELTVDKNSPTTILTIIGFKHYSDPLGPNIKSFSLNNGYVDLKSELICDEGTSSIFSGGTLHIGEGATFGISTDDSLNVDDGGSLEIMGTSTNPACISSECHGYFLNIHNGGAIKAENAIFREITSPYEDFPGINIWDGAFIDPLHCFNYCKFDNGWFWDNNCSLLTIDNDQDLTITGISFPDTSALFNISKNVDQGHITLVDYSGSFSGPAFEYDPYNRIDWVEQSYDLDLTVFLEGPFNTTTNLMETNLNSLLPAAQPFNPALPYYGNPMPDWYYTGAENSPVPNGYVVDWVLVDLRDAASAATATPATSFKQIAAFLLNTGQIVGLDGSSVLSFSHSFLNSLYVAVWHRNHLGVLSANALSRTGDTYSYDFSTGSGQAYGGTSAQKLLGGGKWGMMSGDGNGDGDITVDDINNVWKTEAGTKGYLGGDFNMNTQVENRDKNDNLTPNSGSNSQVPE